MTEDMDEIRKERKDVEREKGGLIVMLLFT